MVLFLCLSFCVSAHHLCQLLSVGVCTAARVEAEQRKIKKKKKKEREGSVHQLTSVMALQFSSSAKCWQSCLCRGPQFEKFSSWHEPQIITAPLDMQQVKKTIFFLNFFLELFFLSACLKSGKLSVTLKWLPVI